MVLWKFYWLSIVFMICAQEGLADALLLRWCLLQSKPTVKWKSTFCFWPTAFPYSTFSKFPALQQRRRLLPHTRRGGKKKEVLWFRNWIMGLKELWCTGLYEGGDFFGDGGNLPPLPSFQSFRCFSKEKSFSSSCSRNWKYCSTCSFYQFLWMHWGQKKMGV